ncbi:MAG TPA: PKD domain-containing protein, partial [Thermoplasmata archaeon]|nr:PKD domain-containing protein [Thermoplasmata archaeon]
MEGGNGVRRPNGLRFRRAKILYPADGGTVGDESAEFDRRKLSVRSQDRVRPRLTNSPLAAGGTWYARPGTRVLGILVASLLVAGWGLGGPAPHARGPPSAPTHLLPAGSALSASVTAAPATGAAPLHVSFTVTATGGAAPFRYLWNFGDGNASSAEDPTHAYAAPGEYAASVTVTDALSEAVTLTRTIDVAPLPLAISLTTSEPTVGAALATTVRANVT